MAWRHPFFHTADATATPSSLATVKSRMVYLSGAGLPTLSWKKSPLNGCSSSSSSCLNLIWFVPLYFMLRGLLSWYLFAVILLSSLIAVCIIIVIVINNIIHSVHFCTYVHRESKKGCHPNHGYNFVNSWSICKILSLLQTAVNFQQNPYWVTHHTLSMLLHYLGKLKNQKFAHRTCFKCDFLSSVQKISAKCHENKCKD